MIWIWRNVTTLKFLKCVTPKSIHIHLNQPLDKLCEITAGLLRTFHYVFIASVFIVNACLEINKLGQTSSYLNLIFRLVLNTRRPPLPQGHLSQKASIRRPLFNFQQKCIPLSKTYDFQTTKWNVQKIVQYYEIFYQSKMDGQKFCQNEPSKIVSI